MTGHGARAARTRHARGEVVAAALALLRRRGLAELSMRNIAAELGVGASALYWHFPDKQSLLAAVSDALLAQAPRARGDGPWPERLRREALLLHGALMASRDGAELVASSLALGLGGHALRARLAEALADRGGALAAQTVEHLLLGHAMHWQQRRQAERLGLCETDPRDEAADFAACLELLIAGLSPQVRATRPR